MLRSTLLSAVLLAAGAVAQTFTSCNPLNTTCPPNPALGTTFEEHYSSAQAEFDPRFWNVTAGTSLITFGDAGANLVLTKKDDMVTVQSNFYIMWGQLEMVFRAAPGQGIISTVILISDDLDEIDWELMGGNHTFVENNYYGWGNQDQRNAQYDPVDVGPQDAYLNYTVDWNAERMQFLVDGRVVRTVPYDVPGKYPQTPMQVRFGIWAAGASNAPGTVEWAGGVTDFKDGPFAMDIKSLRITDGTTNVTQYAYGDHSGSWQSIIGTAGVSQAYQDIHTLTSAQMAAQRWNNLSQGAKIGIAVGVLSVVLGALGIFLYYCMGQRKQGRAERAIADREWQQHTDELNNYRQMMAKGNFAIQNMGHGQRF